MVLVSWQDKLAQKLFGEEKAYKLSGWRRFAVMFPVVTFITAVVTVIWIGILVLATDFDTPYKCEDDYSWSGINCYSVEDTEAQVISVLDDKDTPVNVDRLAHMSGADDNDIRNSADHSTRYYCWTETTGFLSAETYCELAEIERESGGGGKS